MRWKREFSAENFKLVLATVNEGHFLIYRIIYPGRLEKKNFGGFGCQLQDIHLKQNPSFKKLLFSRTSANQSSKEWIS